ncbi:5-hydroxytryptamine receptor 3A-like protein, partial [Lates japonicus]
MRTQYEWLFINMKVTFNNASDLLGQDFVIYTINMKRRSVLYIVNFILPVLFFLGLDLASFLISDNGGEKLSFKVTVLLAVTVLQLILNEILPASSNRIPLVAVYCIGIFALMMLSLLETIFVMYLMEKDSASQDSETDEDRSPSEDCRQQGKADFLKCHGEVHKWTQCACIYDGAGETQTELLSVTKEHNSSKLVEEYHALEKVSGELREMEKTLTLLLDSRKEEVKPGYWTRVAKRVNRWHNEYISWDPNQFCGIDNISLPAEIMWKPDLAIEEMTEMDKAPLSPYLSINNKGYVEVQNDQVLVSTCRMHIYNFPFDIQSCNLSFKSVIHT